MPPGPGPGGRPPGGGPRGGGAPGGMPTRRDYYYYERDRSGPLSRRPGDGSGERASFASGERYDDGTPSWFEYIERAKEVSHFRYYLERDEPVTVTNEKGEKSYRKFKLTDRLESNQYVNIRFLSRIEGIFVGTVHALQEPFIRIRDGCQEARNESRHRGGLISDAEYHRNQYAYKERKYYRLYKWHFISKEKYNELCDKAEKTHITPFAGRAR